MHHVEVVDYRDARRLICDADVLLYRDVPVWRGGRWYSPLIQKAGRSRFSHVALSAWAGPRLLALQTTGFGPRRPALSTAVRRHPGSIDVYRMRPEIIAFDAEGAVREMLKIVQRPYGWWALSQTALIHLAGVRFIARADENDHAETIYPPYCSAAVALAYRRGGGVDLVPNLADQDTEPGDLARSGLLQYQFTLGMDSN